jgi:hypothetical protein
MTDLTVEDIAALREQGDFGAYLRMRFAAPEAAPAAPPPPPPAGHAHGPLHKPGAWPAGTRTDRPTCHPDCDCSLAPHPAARAVPPAA